MPLLICVVCALLTALFLWPSSLPRWQLTNVDHVLKGVAALSGLRYVLQTHGRLLALILALYSPTV